jgi:hypothetical protein
MLRVSWRSLLKLGRTRRNKAKRILLSPGRQPWSGNGQSYHENWMNLDDYKVVLYRNREAPAKRSHV